MGREGLPFSFSRAGEVQYVTARDALDRVVMTGAQILVVGSRAGMYSFPYAGKHRVTVADPDPANIRLLEFAKKTCDEPLNLDTLLLEPERLDGLRDDSFDVVLLIQTLDRYLEPQRPMRALAEAYRVCRVKGHVLVSFLNRDMVPITETIKNPSWFASHFFNPKTHEVTVPDRGAHTLDEARDFLSYLPLDIVRELAVDGHAAVIEEQLDQMSEEAYTNYLTWHLEHCEDPHGLSATKHFLFVCRKDRHAPIAYWDDADTKDEIFKFQKTPFHFRGQFIKDMTLEEGPVSLVLDRTVPAFPERNQAPAYSFRILYEGKDAGTASLRLGYSEHLYYVGNVGYRVYPGYRGQGIAPTACKLLAQVARRHDMPLLSITNDVRNHASARVCEKLGADKKRTVLLPADEAFNLGQRISNIYFFQIQNG